MRPKNEHSLQEQYDPIFDGQQKKIECRNEIIFSITARVMEEDSAGKDISCKEIMTRNYHIPVKEKTNQNDFMNAFFLFLENCLKSSAKHAYENSPETEEKQ